MRQVALDTETTGMNKVDHAGLLVAGHRIIEIGCAEIIDGKVTGRQFHTYVNPEQKVDKRATKIHGITTKFLKDKPKFKEIVSDFLDFLGDSELIIHNAPFDIAFLDKEFHMIGKKLQPHGKVFRVFDTLQTAREMFPNQPNTLEALCRRYEVAHTVEHSALLDAIMLAKVYLKLSSS